LASFGCLWNAFGAPWADFGFHFDSLGSPWALSGRPLGAFGPLWPALGPPLALFGQPLGHIGNFIEIWMSFTEKCVKFTKPYSKITFCVFARRSRRSHGSGVMKCCSDPPFTRAGGQDDVSFTNSLKLLKVASWNSSYANLTIWTRYCKNWPPGVHFTLT